MPEEFVGKTRELFLNQGWLCRASITSVIEVNVTQEYHLLRQPAASQSNNSKSGSDLKPLNDVLGRKVVLQAIVKIQVPDTTSLSD